MKKVSTTGSLTPLSLTAKPVLAHFLANRGFYNNRLTHGDLAPLSSSGFSIRAQIYGAISKTFSPSSGCLAETIVSNQ